MLEDVRKRLRLLVPLIERARKGEVFSDFADTIGEGSDIQLPGTGAGSAGSNEFVQFRKKAEHFLKQNLGEAPVAKVRSGAPITPADIADLQRILVAAGIGDQETFAAASERAGDFGRFVRLIVGLDRAAAKAAFDRFLDDKRYSRNQIEFVNMIIDELTERGVVEATRIYEPPFTGIAPEGPETIFVDDDVNRIFDAIAALTTNAAESGFEHGAHRTM